MSRTRVRHRRLATTIVVAAVGGAWAVPAVRALGPVSEPAPVSAARYVVQQGDTLWSIAERLAPGGDPRPVVDALAAANHVEPGALIPGQALVVPSGV